MGFANVRAGTRVLKEGTHNDELRLAALQPDLLEADQRLRGHIRETELTAQVGISEFSNCKTWYENERVCGIERFMPQTRSFS